MPRTRVSCSFDPLCRRRRAELGAIKSGIDEHRSSASPLGCIRLLAYFFLSAMEDALQTFQRYVTEHGTPLTGELWHVKGKYAAIRARARANVTGGCIRGIGANYRGVDVETRKRWRGASSTH